MNRRVKGDVTEMIFGRQATTWRAVESGLRRSLPQRLVIDGEPAGLEQIIKQLSGDALGWFSKGLSGLKMSSESGAKPIACPHLQLRWAMEKRRLAVIEKDVSGFLDNGKNYGLQMPGLSGGFSGP